MDTISWHMNAMQGGGGKLHPGVNLHPGANCAQEHGLRDVIYLPSSVIV